MIGTFPYLDLINMSMFASRAKLLGLFAYLMKFLAKITFLNYSKVRYSAVA